MFSVMVLDDRMFHFMSAATIRQLLETPLQDINAQKV
jgi:hypothetical protein